MKQSIHRIAVVAACILTANAESPGYDQFLADHKVANRAEKSEAGQRRLDWWRDARFGMFIHWDPSSVAACEMSWSKLYYDVIGEMAKACEKAGMKFGIYYSQRDWHHPDYGPQRMAKYNEYMRNQIKELLVRHPNISILWFDSEDYPFELWEGDALYRMMHQLRPDIIINDRCGLPGDYKSPEQHIGDFDLERDWESNMTFTGFWSWHGYQTKVIPYEECLHRLVQCAGGNGNQLMNIGPMPTGEIDTREADRLKRVGQWLTVNGEAIYGTRGGPFKPNDTYATTRKDRTIFVHVMKWTKDHTIELPKIPAELVSFRLLNGRSVMATQTDNNVRIKVTPENQTPGVTVVALEFNKDTGSF